MALPVQVSPASAIRLDHTAPWPLGTPMPGLAFAVCDYPLDGRDFQPAGIVLPANLQHAVARRRAEFLAGRQAAREALQQVGGQGVPQQGRGRAPCWPAGFVGSISHSQGVAVALAARQQHWCALGIDLEQPLTRASAREMASQILHPQELAMAERGEPWALTLAFSLKESLFKALYPQVRRIMDFHAASVVGWQDGYAEIRLQQDWSLRWRSGLHLSCRYTEYRGSILSMLALPQC